MSKGSVLIAFITLSVILQAPSAMAEVDCSLLDPRESVSSEKEGKITASVNTLLKIAKAGGSVEGKMRSEVQNLQKGTSVTEKSLVELRTLYLFCGMVANAKDIATDRKVELFNIMMKVKEKTANLNENKIKSTGSKTSQDKSGTPHEEGRSDKIIKSTTSGNNSSAYAAGRDININSGITAEEVTALKQVCKNLNDDYASSSKEAAEYKQRLIQIHQNSFNSLPEDANNWATYFIATLPTKNDEILAIEHAKRELSDRVKIKLPIFISYIFENFDSRILALRKYKSDIVFNRETTIDFSLLFGPSRKSTSVRQVKLSNGNTIDVVLRQGIMTGDLITSYPRLDFNVNGNIVFFIEGEEGRPITPRQGMISHLSNSLIRDIYYHVDDDSLITDQFNKSFADSINKLVEFAFLGRISSK